VNGDAYFSSALARKIARQYLSMISIQYTELFKRQGVDLNTLKKDLTWPIELGIMSKFAGPVIELSQDLDPIELDKFADELASGQARLLRYYGSKIAENITWSERVLAPLVLEWVCRDSEHQKTLDRNPCDTNRFNAAMVIAAQLLLDKLPERDARSEGRQLYTAALLFSSMLFMTAGYGDIIPNSIMTDMVMFLQFVVYIVSFVILLPQLK
jgi:hypothetical protein